MQSTATPSAAQTWLIRALERRPIRSASSATGTDSIESRLTTQSCGTASSPGSSRTSEGKFRMRVVQGATMARRRRCIAAVRERTRTGRRGTSGSSHHHSSPRSITGGSRQRPCASSRGLPTRRTLPSELRRRPNTERRSQWTGVGAATLAATHPGVGSQGTVRSSEQLPTARRPRLC